jgi:hypothetical protein
MQAYPFQHKDPTTGLTNISVGMTLRDYFAAKAMQELMTYKDRPVYLRPVDEVATDAYDMADAMMEARK